MGKVERALSPLNPFQSVIHFQNKEVPPALPMAYPGTPGSGGGSQDQQLPRRELGQSSAPRPHSLPDEDMGLRHFPRHKACQDSASTAEGQEASKSTESTQILVGETQVLKHLVRDREIWDKCLNNVGTGLVSLFCDEKVCKDRFRHNVILSSVGTL